MIDARIVLEAPDAELAVRLPERWGRFLPAYGGSFSYVAPAGIFGDDEPSSVGATREFVFGDRRSDCSILVPRGRGFLPDLDFSAAIAAATNQWLVETWLDQPEAGNTVFGSIRVDPRNAERAIGEIRRWAAHPGMVQIVVPLQAHQPYGHRDYRAVWQEAAEHGLAISTMLEEAAGVDYWRTPVGEPRVFAEHAALTKDAALYHLVSLVVEGALDIVNTAFIFGDGGGDLLAPYSWRLEKQWRGLRASVPWVTGNPVEIIEKRARFITSGIEGPPEDQLSAARWLKISGGDARMLYGSHFPTWEYTSPDDLFPGASPDVREAIMSGNALTAYPRIAQRISQDKGTG